MKNIKWLEPWEAIIDGALFEAELQTEVCRGHPLYQIEVKAIGRRLDCDDVLFALANHSHALAVVHLTYARESNPGWPQTRLFADTEDWTERGMKPDNRDYRGDDAA